MKSRATRKREVTRHVISCELLFISDSSLSPGFLLREFWRSKFISPLKGKINSSNPPLFVNNQTEKKNDPLFA